MSSNFLKSFLWRLRVLSPATFFSMIKYFSAFPHFPNVAGRPSNLVTTASEDYDLALRSIGRVAFRNFSDNPNEEPSDVNLMTKPQLESSGSQVIELKNWLDEAFAREGSDKGVQGYSQIYAEVLSRRATHRILEVGLGTNNTKLLSNMGKHGSPKASLRVWRTLPGVELPVIGADIDRQILINEDGIAVFYVDQMSDDGWPHFLAQEPLRRGDFSLIIDDGMHSPGANLNTFSRLCSQLAKDGTYIIEDVHSRSVKFWTYVAQFISENWKVELRQISESQFAVVMKRRV